MSFAEQAKKGSTKAYKVAMVLDAACGDGNEFSSSADRIYSLFANLEKELPDVFGDFVFEERNVHPFSQEVHDALFDLENAGIIGEPNPTYVIYSWKGERKKIRDSISERFDPAVISRVKEAVTRLGPTLSICKK